MRQYGLFIFELKESKYLNLLEKYSKLLRVFVKLVQQDRDTIYQQLI